MGKFNVKVLRTPQDIIQACQLRYKILFEEQSKHIHNTYHSANLVIDNLDDISYLIGCYDQGKLVGTARGTLFKEAGITGLENIYQKNILALKDGATLKNSAYASRFVVLKEYRHHDVSLVLLKTLLAFAKRQNIRFGFMSVMKDMIPYYQLLGGEVIDKAYFKDYESEMYLLVVDSQQCQVKPQSTQNVALA